MAKDKAKGAKGAPKKEPINWAKIAIPLLMVFIMVGSIFAFVISNPFSSDKKSGLSEPLGSVQDALRLLPPGASFVRYVDMSADTQLKDYVDSNYWNTLPPASIFSADPKKDALAVYPAGYFGYNTQSLVSLTDFGTTKINKSYPAYTMGSNIVLAANDNYYFTSDTSPVLSGGPESVATTLNYFGMRNNSSYATYSGLFNKLNDKRISIDGMDLATVGNTFNVPFENASADAYYAGIGPAASANASARNYTYVVIAHLNRTLSDQEYGQLALYSTSMVKTGFEKYNTQVYDDYIVIEAQGPLNVCTENMVNWGFMKYEAGSSQ